MQNSKDLLTFLRQRLLAKSVGSGDDAYILTSLSKVQAQFKPHPQDMPYSDVIVVAQTWCVGSCYCYCEDPVLPTDILGMDARNVQTGNRCIDIAVLDAAYSNVRPQPSIRCLLEGTSFQKAEARASLIHSEIQSLSRDIQHDNPHITMVGAVGNILSVLSDGKNTLYATDFDTTLIGKKLGGVLVEHGSMTLSRISQSQIALVTGMTLTTDTLRDIIVISKQNNVKVIVYAQTGGNLAGEYLELGVDCVISEEYPFYMFPGITKVSIFRNAR